MLGVARSSPELEACTLELPDREAGDDVASDMSDEDRGFFAGTWQRGDAFADAPEAARITRLWGDSATFDFSPCHAGMDAVFVDGAHSLAYVGHDTEAAFAPWHVAGTRLVVYSRRPLLAG